MTKIIEVKNLSKHYFAEDVVIKAVDDISFSIEKEEVVAIIGKSGSGKSTLLNMLSGLDTTDILIRLTWIETKMPKFIKSLRARP